MNKNKFNLRQIFIRLILLAGIALLSACAKSALSTVPSVKTDAPAVSEASPSQVAMPVSLDADPMGLTFHIESISAPDDPGSLPYWENMPAYTLLTLENYPLSDHRLEPKIYLFPLADLALVNHQADQIAEDLGELLAYPQDQLELPFLPLKKPCLCLREERCRSWNTNVNLIRLKKQSSH